MVLGKFLKYTGKGLGFVGKAAGRFIDRHAGIIGKGIGAAGRAMFLPFQRRAYSAISDKAISLMPKGKVRDTLSIINDAAQGRVPRTDNPYAHDPKLAIQYKRNPVIEND